MNQRQSWLTETEKQVLSGIILGAGLVSGAGQFIGPYTKTGLQSLFYSLVATAICGIVAALVVLALRMAHRSIRLSRTGIVVAGGALCAAGAIGGVIGYWLASPQGPGAVTASSSRPSPTSPSSTSSIVASTTSAPPPGPATVRVRCDAPAQLRRNQSITLTYHLESSAPIDVGLGAGLRDTAGNDYSTGDGDIDQLHLSVGSDTVSRQFTIPSNVPRGEYELTAEIWPANNIGKDGVETLADSICIVTTIP